MKSLFDENLSPKLVHLLHDLFPESVHVRDVGLSASADTEVWKYAQDNSLIICSKDSDMSPSKHLLQIITHLSSSYRSRLKPDGASRQSAWGYKKAHSLR